MLTKLLLAVLASALVGMSGAASPLTADCVSHNTKPIVGTNNGGSFTVPFIAGTGAILTETLPVSAFNENKGLDIVNLGVTLAPAVGCSLATSALTTGPAEIQLGLYQLINKVYILQAQVPTFTVSAADVKSGITLSRAVLFAGLQPLTSDGSYSIGFSTNNPLVCLEGNTLVTPQVEDSTYVFNPATLPPSFNKGKSSNPDFLATALLCLVDGGVIGDPVFTGFNGQQFTVKGEAGTVFNLISSPALSFNNRFVALATEEESMSATAQKAMRAQIKASKLKALVKGIPPVTAPWNHAGTYMGESGITLGESQLYVAPGAYATGFSTVTLNGVAVPISSTPIELDGDMTVTRPSAFKLTITTPTVRFTLVNSDKFINIEHAKVLSADADLTGLLGQTVDAAWEVVQSAEFTQHIENDYKVASNKLF